MQLEFKASQMNIADLIKLSGQQIPVSGTLNAGISLHGTELNPIGNGDVSLTNITAFEQPAHSLKLTFSGAREEAQGELSVQLPAGSLRGKWSVRPNQRTYTAELIGVGIQLDKLQALKSRNIDASGVLGLDSKAQGSFDNPQLNATLRIPTLTMEGQTLSGLNLQLNVADHAANATLVTAAANTSVQAKAKVQLTGDYLVDASVDTQGIPLRPIFAVYARKYYRTD